MPVKLLETARTRRRLALEKKRLKDDMRDLRRNRMAYRPAAEQQRLELKPPAA